MVRQATMKRFLFAVPLLLFSNTALAAETGPPSTPKSDLLRSPGTIVLDDVVGGGFGGPLTFTLGWFSIQSSMLEEKGVRSTSTSIGFAPSLDVFVFEGFSVGGLLGVARTSMKTSTTEALPPGVDAGTGETTTTSRFVSPRVGYAFRLSDDLVLWPRFRVGYGNADTSVSSETPAIPLGVTSPAGHGETWSIGGDASLLFVLGKHAAIAAGPYLTYSHAKQDDPHAVATTFDVSIRGALRLVF